MPPSRTVYGWQYGFGVAAIFMLLGLATFLYGYWSRYSGVASVACSNRDDFRAMAEKDEEKRIFQTTQHPPDLTGASEYPQPLNRVVRGDGFFVVTGPGE